MKQQKRIVGAVLVTLMVSAAVLWWACDFEKVSPTESLTTKVSDIVSKYGGTGSLSETKLATILEKLAYCQTQADAVKAIDLLLEKTGIRRSNTPLPPPPQQNKYAVFLLPDPDLAKLAAWHLSFVNGTNIMIIGNNETTVKPLTIGETFNAFKNSADYINQEFKLDGDIDKILQALQKDATKAQLDPEDPDNALLLALTAEGATISTNIPLFDLMTFRSPVQHFLFALWLTVEYGKLKATPSPVKAKDLCILRCLSPFIIDVFLCQFELVEKQKEECMQAAAHNFNNCVESCLHDQGSGGN